MTQLHRITVATICGGRPTIRGPRIRVKDVLELLAAGADRAEILADCPYLEADDITAVLGAQPDPLLALQETLTVAP